MLRCVLKVFQDVADVNLEHVRGRLRDDRAVRRDDPREQQIQRKECNAHGAEW
jgi:hypothetical protein